MKILIILIVQGNFDKLTIRPGKVVFWAGTMGFGKRFIQFAVSLINEQGFEYEAGGKLVSCHQCGRTKFLKSKAQLNTKELTILRLDFFDKSAKMLQCKNCGYILWFGKSPKNRILSKQNVQSTT